MALGQLGAVVAQDHRQVRILRHGRAQRLEDVDLARGVVDVVVAADDVADLHVPVVHHHAEVVGGRAVAARDDEVVELGIGKLDDALDQVLPRHRAVGRIPEAHHRLHAGRRHRQRLAGFGAPAAVVARLFAACALRLAHRVEFLGAAVAVIGLAAGQHLLEHFLVAIQALGLVERAFVVIQIQPGHAVEDRLHRLGGRARDVGVFDAQDELAAVMTRERPREQRGARAADMQITGGGGGEAGADHGGAGREKGAILPDRAQDSAGARLWRCAEEFCHREARRAVAIQHLLQRRAFWIASLCAMTKN